MRLARSRVPSSAQSRLVRKWWRIWCVMALVTVVFGLGASIFVGVPAAAPQPVAAAPQCAEPAGVDPPVDRLHVTADHVLDGDDHVFTPDGISVFGGLQDGDGGDDWTQALAFNTVQITAAGQYWHANTVRIPVSEGNLFSGDTPRCALQRGSPGAQRAHGGRHRRPDRVSRLGGA